MGRRFDRQVVGVWDLAWFDDLSRQEGLRYSDGGGPVCPTKVGRSGRAVDVHDVRWPAGSPKGVSAPQITARLSVSQTVRSEGSQTAATAGGHDGRPVTSRPWSRRGARSVGKPMAAGKPKAVLDYCPFWITAPAGGPPPGATGGWAAIGDWRPGSLTGCQLTGCQLTALADPTAGASDAGRLAGVSDERSGDALVR